MSNGEGPATDFMNPESDDGVSGSDDFRPAEVGGDVNGVHSLDAGSSRKMISGFTPTCKFRVRRK